MTNPRETFSVVEKTPEFQRDFKRLLKKFKSLEDDLENFQKFALKAFHKLGQENLGIVQIPGLAVEYPKVYKATKFACKALKGRGSATGIRIIYAYYPDKDMVCYIEIYFKADQENEDRERIKRIVSAARGGKNDL